MSGLICTPRRSGRTIYLITDNENPRLERPRQFQQLIDDVEELLARLEDEHSPQLDDLHRRLETTVAKAKSALHKRVRSTSFTSGMFFGGLLGFLLASVRSND